MMKKKLLSLLLMLCLTVAVLAISANTAHAASATTLGSGKCGDNLTWTLTSDGTLTISGTGAMYDYSLTFYEDREGTTAPWDNWYDSITKLVVNNGVTTVGNYAFYNCDFTNRLIVPNSITAIGDCAFAYCDGFVGKLFVPANATIGNFAFMDSGFTIRKAVNSGKCGDNLTWALEEDGTITVFGTGPMYNYEETEVYDSYLDEMATDLTAPWYDLRRSLTKLVIEDGVTAIGDNAFRGCYNFTGSLTIPNGVTTIGDNAFRDCYNFTGSLTIPNGVTTIGDNAFQSSDGFTGSLTIPNSVTTIGNDAFAYCDGFTGSLTLGNRVTTIGDNAFIGCSFTGGLTIPNSVTTIGKYAFQDCSGFTGSLTLGNKVTTIGDRAFQNCGFTGSLTIPNSVTTISDYAFQNCNGFTGTLTLGNKLTTIEQQAFYKCGFTGSLTIPDSMIKIGYYAFSGCDFTGSLTIPNGVTDIGSWAFQNCDFDGKLTLGNKVTTIGCWAFDGCSFTGSLTIPNSVTIIDAYAFAGNFTGSLTLGNKLTTIGHNAFRECAFTGNLVIPNSVTTIENDVFRDCGFTGSLTIPNSVTTIGNYAFSGCNFTGSLTIPSSIETISDYAFYNCGFTGNLTIPNGVTTIDACAFKECGFIGSLTIPDSVTMIDASAFFGCKFTDVTFGTGLQRIVTYAFKNCYELEEITFTGPAPNIYKQAFTGVTATARYSCVDSSWTSDYLQNYDGTLIWESYNPFNTNAKPTVTVSNITYNSFTVNWTKVEYATGYEIWRSTSPNSGFKRLGISTGENLSIVSSGLVTNTKYYFKIRAIQSLNGTVNYGAYSTVQSGTPTLNAPSNFKAVNNGYNSVKLTWTVPAGAQYIELYRSEKPTTEFKKVGTYTAETLQKVQSGLDTGKTYYYRIRAYRVVNGYKKYSQYTVVKSATPTLAAPTISVAKNSYNSLKITWSKVSGATAYELYRSTDPNTGFKKLGTYTAETLSKISSSLATGTQYYYKVRAYRVVDGYKKYSDYSAVKSGTPTLSAPTGVKAVTGTTKGTVKVSWSKTDGATYYQVYRREVGGTKWSLLGVYDSDTLSMTSKKLASGKTYEYRVRCYRWSGGVRQFSGWSTIVSAKAK